MSLHGLGIVTEIMLIKYIFRVLDIELSNRDSKLFIPFTS